MLESVLYGGLVVFGVGLVIFVHELGHFLAARAVGVRVEAFSIGFGKRIWGFRRGPTEYKVCLIPLGGYVKMAGEDPTRPTTGAPDEFGSKKVWQRTLVISAGVIMNMVFALVALPIAFQVGVKFDAPVLGYVSPGQPAWEAGLRRGDRIVAINGDRILSFSDIREEVAISSGSVSVTYERDGTRSDVAVKPKASSLGFPRIGVRPSLIDAIPVPAQHLSQEQDDEESRAAAAALVAAGFLAGDELLGVEGIPASRFDVYLNEELQDQEAKPLTCLVRRDGRLIELQVSPVHRDLDMWRIGIRAVNEPERRVSKVVRNGPAWRFGLRPGDRILEVNGTRPGGIEHRSVTEMLGDGEDVRRTARALAPADPPAWQEPLVLTVAREGEEPLRLTGVLATRAERAAFLESMILESTQTTRVTVADNAPAASAGMMDGDVIKRIAGSTIRTWSDVASAIKDGDGAPLEVVVQRGDRELTLTIKPERMRANVVLSDVLSMQAMDQIVTEKVQIPFPESLTVGVNHAFRMLKRVVRTLRSIIRGSVSARNLGGPITIFRVSYHYSKIGLMRGLLFMAVISINLAILNILPIPVLDGGWLMFLIIEKIKGSPISERAMGYFQWMGLILILGLMVFVTWNDLDRWISSLMS